MTSSSSQTIWIGVYASLDGWVSRVAISAANKKDALAGLLKVIRDEGIEDRVEPAMTDVWLLEDILEEGVLATRSDISVEPADLRRHLVLEQEVLEEDSDPDREEYMDALQEDHTITSSSSFTATTSSSPPATTTTTTRKISQK